MFATRIYQQYTRCILALALLVVPVFGCAQPLTYPEAPVRAVTDTYHGERVTDDYQWMEDLEHPDLQVWLDQQNDLLKTYMRQSGRQQQLEQRILELQGFTSFARPVIEGSTHLFHKVNTSGRADMLYVRNGQHGREQVLVDVTDTNQSINGYFLSPDERHVAYYVGGGQSRWSALRIINIASRVHGEELDGLHTYSGPVAWDRSGDGFFYSRIDPAAGEANVASVLSHPRVFYHRLGTPQAEDQLIYERADESSWLYSLAMSQDNRYLVFNVTQGQTGGTGVLYLDRQQSTSGVQTLVLSDKATHTFLGNEGQTFYLFSTEDAPKGRIIGVDTRDTRPDIWKEVVAERPETISGSSQTGGNAVAKINDHFVAMYLKDALPLVRVFGLDGELKHEIDLPGVGSIWGGFSAAYEEDAIYYRFLALTTPGDVYRLAIQSGELERIDKAEIAVNTDDFEGKQVFFTSKDGTRVPMLLVHKKGLALDGNHPLIMYGYGALNWVSFVWYQPHIVAWLEMGGVYALPQIRGGGEYGASWAEAGKGLNKPNTIMDYVAAAEWLVENGYTRSDYFVANGGSASALLPATGMNQQPSLFGAATVDIPILDMLRYHQFSGAQFWVSEYGTSEDTEAFEVIRSYSPYANIKPAVCYPPTMVTVGSKDETAPPFHGYKYVAQLQAAQGCDHPVLLQVVEGAGHSFGTSQEQTAQTLSRQLAFLIEALDLPMKNGAFAMGN